MKVGDIQIDANGLQWVVISVFGRDRISRVRRNSIAHHIHAKGSAEIAKSLTKEDVGSTETTSEESS